MNKTIKRLTVLLVVLSIISMNWTWAKYAKVMSSSFSLDILLEEYTLLFDANGGRLRNGTAAETELASQTVTSVYALSEYEPINVFGSFLGWDTSENASQVIYAAEDTLDVEATGVTALYAVWDVLANFGTDQLKYIASKNLEADGANEYHDIGFAIDGVQSKFERVYVNLGELDTNFAYKIEFQYSVDGVYNDSSGGGYGWQVVSEAAKNEATLTTRTENLKLCPRSKLQPLLNSIPAHDASFTQSRDCSTVFVPSSGDNYLYLELSRLADGGVQSSHYLDGLKITKLGEPMKHNFVNSEANLSTNLPVDVATYEFVLNTKLGTHEIVAIPLTYDFVEGMNYEIEFEFGGPTSYIGSYTYNYTVTDDTSYLSSKDHTDLTNDWMGILEKNTTKTYESVFTATTNKMYLMFHFAELKDDSAHNIYVRSITITPTDEPATLY